MTSLRAVITYKGVSTHVVVSETSEGTTIVDADGNPYYLPSDVMMDPKGTGKLIQDNEIAGDIVPDLSTPLVTSPAAAATPSTSVGTGAVGAGATSAGGSSSTSGSGSATSSAGATTPSATDANTTASPVGGIHAPVTAATRNLKDDGAHTAATTAAADDDTVVDPDVEGKIDPGAAGPGGVGPAATTPPPASDDTTPEVGPPNPGPWGVGNPQHEQAPAGTYKAAGKSALDKFNSVSGMASGILAALTKLGPISSHVAKPTAFVNQAVSKVAGEGAGHWGSLANASKLGKGIGVAGVALAAVSAATAILDWRKNGASAGNVMNLLSSSFSILWILGFSNPIGWAIIAGAIITGLLIHLGPKKDNDVNVAKGDVYGNTNMSLEAPAPSSWAQVLPVNSVFMILSGVTALGLGFNFNPLDLSNNGPTVRQEIIASSLVPTFNQRFIPTLQAATNTTINGTLLGKVFIKKGGDGVADKVVYMTEFTNEDPGNPNCAVNATCQAVNMVALNEGGYLTSTFKPSDRNMLQPFYVATQDGSIKPNPGAFNDLGQMGALVKVPSGATATGSAVAINMAAMMGHSVAQSPTPPTAQ